MMKVLSTIGVTERLGAWNQHDEHRLVLLQGDRRQNRTPAGGVTVSFIGLFTTVGALLALTAKRAH